MLTKILGLAGRNVVLASQCCCPRLLQVAITFTRPVLKME